VSILLWPLYPMMLVTSFLVGLIPARVGYAGAWLFGTIAYYLLPNRRRVMSANFAPVIGRSPHDPEVQRLGKLSFRNFARYLYDFLAMPHRSIDQIDQIVALHLDDHFHQARALGKGMIFVSAHFGNMDYTAIAVAKHTCPLTVVADPIKPKQLMDQLVKYRGQKGLNMVYLAKAPRAILTALKHNEAVGFLVDVGCRREGGIPVTFFGRRTMFPTGPALLALRTGAPVVVGYTVVNGAHMDAYSYPPIFATKTGDKDADARRCSQMIASHFEDFLRRHPEQWYIYRQMWGPDSDSGAPLSPIGEPPVQEPLTETA
jgi:lauroyl/myristoyl acyltransferase